MGDIAYVVWYNNGEQWEDNIQEIDGVFSTREKATKYLVDRGYEKNIDYRDSEIWTLVHEPCRAGVKSCRDCKDEKCPFYVAAGDYDECEDAAILDENDFDQSFCIIREMIVDPEPNGMKEVVF